MAILHRAYMFDAQAFISELKSIVIAQDNLLLEDFRQVAINAVEIPSPDMQEALTWMRYDAEEWFGEEERGAGEYFLILLASKLSAAPSLSSRETIETYFQQLYYPLQKARWHQEDYDRLVRGNKLPDMIRFYDTGLANILLEQPFFASTIWQSGAGWLSLTDAKQYYERLKLARHHFNKFPSVRQINHKIWSGIPINSPPHEQIYEKTTQMLEASIDSNKDLILIID